MYSHCFNIVDTFWNELENKKVDKTHTHISKFLEQKKILQDVQFFEDFIQGIISNSR